MAIPGNCADQYLSDDLAVQPHVARAIDLAIPPEPIAASISDGRQDVFSPRLAIGGIGIWVVFVGVAYALSGGVR